MCPLAPHAQRVAQRGASDPVDEDAARAVVRVARDGVFRSEPDELPLLLEEAGERGVVHLHRLEPELRLERRRRLRSLAELAYGARPVELRATPLEPEQRQDRVR